MNVLTVIMVDMNVLDDSPSTVTFAPDDRDFVYSVVRRMVGTPDDADDVTQDALLLAYRHRSSFRGDARYRTWLYRIAATTALSHLRRKRRARVSVVPDGDERVLEQWADPAGSPEALVAAAEDRAWVRRALSELPASYREVLLARADATEPEVADHLGISVANVKIRAHRARRQLRACLERVAA
jgi:RNA polymerase sigma-70 factor (ECF subfamily)